jgi:KDO2-lipid IV(A) lauroyltransferase
VVCAALRKAPLQFEMQVADVVDPQEADFPWGTIPLFTGWYTRCLEQLIRQSPQQYWWVHRRWKGVPLDRRAIRRWQREQRAA